MKKLWIVAAVLLIVQACGSNSGEFTIEGNMKNANGEEMYLVEITQEGTNKVDSVQLDKEGHFTFNGYTNVAKFFLVQTGPRNSVTLVVEPGDQIELTADVNKLGEDYQVEGSEGSREVMKLNNRLKNTIASLDSLGRIYRENQGKEGMTALRDRLNQESRRIIQEQKAYTRDFIDRNTTSLSSLMALYQQIGPRSYVLSPQDDFKYFEKVDSALMANYPNSEPVKSLHSQVEEMRKQMESDKSSKERLAIGNKAPEITLPNPQGDTVALSDLRGSYVLLDFWASWCKPCRVENPNLVKAHKRYSDENFEIYQVSLDKNRKDWVNAIEKDNLDWYHVSDLKFWNSSAAQTYNIRSIPANYLLNRKGEIIEKNLRGDALQAKLNEIFAGE
ncbi:MAG TPA: TlpA disulfide reductase family protein [Bacteroidales bacterium]|nr:TlpA disulfide reductase family protein [Bacteroidales bacterium]